ncbi:MAG: hypothetical protein AB201_02405 [Parcubacteria bacterium C7867-006]|nr:MAG: hypothetical protein AB201_02405 [Parcubacteria bacterium C7867-006]
MLSLVLTALFLLFAFYQSRPSKTAKPEEGQEKKSSNERHNLWYHLGFVDDTPNLIRQVVAGSAKSGRPIRYFGNLHDGVIDEATGIITSNPNPPLLSEGWFLNLIRKHFGKRWCRIPIIQHVKPLTIDRVVSKDTKSTVNELSDELDASTVVKEGLYRLILRPTLHKDVDAKNNIRFSVISYAVLEVFDAKPAFNIYPDSYLITVSKLISAYLSKNTFKLSYDEYKERGNSFEKEQIDELNGVLLSLGIRCKELRMGDPELNKSVQESLEKEAKAEQEAKAQKRKGQGQKDYDTLVSEGQSQAIRNLAAAKASRFSELINLYKNEGLTGSEAVDRANAMISAEFNADAVRQLQGTYVASGNGVQLAVMERRPSATTSSTTEAAAQAAPTGSQSVGQASAQPAQPVAQKPMAPSTTQAGQTPHQNQGRGHKDKGRRNKK